MGCSPPILSGLLGPGRSADLVVVFVFSVYVLSCVSVVAFVRFVVVVRIRFSPDLTCVSSSAASDVYN